MSVVESYLGAYWGDRKEGPVECATRIRSCLAALADTHPLFRQWYIDEESCRREADSPVSLEIGKLTSLVERGQVRDDASGESIHALGYTVVLWNGASLSTAMSCRIGAYPSVPGLMNNFVLRLPSDEGDARGIYQRETAGKMLSAVVASMQPDWATLGSYDLAMVQSVNHREPILGWLTYLAEWRFARRPDGFRVQPFDGGFLYVAADSFEETDGAMVQAARRELEGSLGPTP